MAFVVRNVRWIVAYMFIACMVASLFMLVQTWLDNSDKALPLILKYNQLYSFPIGIIVSALFVRSARASDLTFQQATLCIILAGLWNGVIVAEAFYASRSHVDQNIHLTAVVDLVDRSVAALSWITALVLGFLYQNGKNEKVGDTSPVVRD